MSATHEHFRSSATFVKPDSTPKPHFLDAFAKHVLLRRLSALREGQLTLIDGDAIHCFGAPTDAFPLSVAVQVHDQRFYSDVVFGGSIGAGEAYMQGYWSTAELTAVMRLFVRNMGALDAIESGFARITTPMQKVLHRFNRNTRSKARKNIAAHYDLGNEFFQLFLDDTMMYSSALFATPTMTLKEAQLARLKELCDKLDLQATDHVLEIGTGWGGFAIYAATHYGCKVTTATISKAQHALAIERVKAAGLEDRISVKLSDYRDLEGEYEKLISIEMIEAVGHEYYDGYFSKCSALLKPDGLMALQAITIADQRYERAIKSVDFIQRYIFPGSCIPSVTALTASLTRATDLRVFDLQDIGPHYALTLCKWRENFLARLDRVKQLRYDDAFIRMWEYYFCYCEGGFIERAIGDVQMVLVKPRNRRATIR